ncbi:VC0807 family protein [Actinocatenispora rupis]|uniref:Intracellular septation protein A n=1 Tax=Actinocatenispora rupis TaxID=519421 RepID=A0A8J3JEJ4_9ACTN|nr:VC0807 family protein [Actinocatenispora rupis]GID15249.1 hypothetical protein Aru02nite_61380 [Actinocatenispora rupis]
MRIRPLTVVDFVVPTAAYYVLRFAGVHEPVALVAGAVLSVVSGVGQLVWRRKIAAMPVFWLVVMLASLAVSLLVGSPRFLLARDAIGVAAGGVAFLLSLRFRRPVTFTLCRPLLEKRFGTSADWDDAWRLAPRFRRLWRVNTVIWGVALLADAVLRVAMAYALPIDVAPGANTVQYVVFTVLMMAVTNVHLTLAGLWRVLHTLPRTTALSGGTA